MMSPLVEEYVWTCQSISARIKHLLLVKPLGTKLEDRDPEDGSDGAFAGCWASWRGRTSLSSPAPLTRACSR
jgi:hypothetical protein